MSRFGAVLLLFGFGSALLHFTSVRFRLLMWAEPMQPVLGLAMAGVGVALLVIMASLDRGESKEQPAQASGWPPNPRGGLPPNPGYGPPPASPPAGFAGPSPVGVPTGLAGSAPVGPPVGPPAGYPGPPLEPRPMYAPPGAIPRQGPQFGQRPPLGPPQQYRPQENFGPQGGPPYGPRG